MINWNEFAKEVHENAVAHGWWDNEREWGELIALVHSELSEALEEYRNGHALNETYYREDGKPEGIPSELADVVIRLLDICGKYGYSLSLRLDGTKIDYSHSFPVAICEIHKPLSNLYNTYECLVDDDLNSVDWIEIILEIIIEYCEFKGIDIEKAILEKYEYNKTRPYKHGGKVI